jgi:hypothetical protein
MTGHPTEQVDRVRQALEPHMMWSVACPCGDWIDTGPGPKRIRHNYAEHVAEAVCAALDAATPELIAEIERLRAGGAWVEHVERQRE